MLNNNTPLWLPEGSIRAVVALGLVGAFIAGAVDLEVALLVLGFYFGSRASAPSLNGPE